jgi:hypothetical protein
MSVEVLTESPARRVEIIKKRVRKRPSSYLRFSHTVASQLESPVADKVEERRLRGGRLHWFWYLNVAGVGLLRLEYSRTLRNL